MKYSINSIGFIVAERDIYSLGGFIPKNSVGCKVANGDQISQDGDCWVAGGDISARPDVRVKDNAYIGTFTPGGAPVHTDGITEFSGNTLIPGNISVRSLVADTKNDVFVKDSFIGVSMDVLCGPSTVTTAFPFEQGRLDHTKPAGTPTAGMAVVDANSCFSNSVMRCGNDTQIYVPANMTARVLWVYRNNSDVLTYSGESELLQPGLKKVSHLTYKVGVVVFSSATAMTPANLLATGAKILGHINSSLLQDFRPESASGSYVMDKSSFVVKTSNFGLATNRLWYTAGGLYNTSAYTLDNRAENKLYGTFHSVQRLEYTRYLSDSHRTAATRDTYISAYDCRLLRVDDTTYNDALAARGNLVLRRCTVPKAEFQNDVINGNTYKDIDFSYANEDLGYTMTGYTRFVSSHKQGVYRLSGGPSPVGFASHKGNLADTARLYQAEKYIPLDGSIVEQGTYAASVGQFYEEGKSGSASTRIRTGKPVPTFGLVLPVMPSGYVLAAAHYLDEGFKFANSAANPSSINTDYPYVVFVITKADPSESALISEFIALNGTLRIIDYTKAPEVTGSAYVGAGCTVRGDVKLIGDPYVNRLLDVDKWERGTMGGALNGTDYESGKAPTGAGNRLRFVDSLPVESGDVISCAEGYYMYAYWYDGFGVYSSQSNWGRTFVVTGNNRFLGIVLKKASSAADVGGLIEDSDIPLANVKHVRAFKKRRYIVNELDRTSPEDIFLGQDAWRSASLSTADTSIGRTYAELTPASNTWCIMKQPINAGASWVVTLGDAVTYAYGHGSWDSLTKLLGRGIRDNAALMGLELKKVSNADIVPAGVAAARLVVEFVPQPRIVAPYGQSTLFISGPKIRMYDNAVLSRNLTQEGEIVLRGDAVGGYDFNPGSCMCSNGHSDAIIKLP